MSIILLIFFTSFSIFEFIASHTTFHTGIINLYEYTKETIKESIYKCFYSWSIFFFPFAVSVSCSQKRNCYPNIKRIQKILYILLTFQIFTISFFIHLFSINFSASLSSFFVGTQYPFSSHS